MANADNVLVEAALEAHLLIFAGTPPDQQDLDWYEREIKPLVDIAGLAALHRGGEIDDDLVRNSSLPPSRLSRLV